MRQDLALDAVRCVALPAQNGGQAEIDIKKYVKVEKIPGGSLDDCRVLAGVMFNKARPPPPPPPRAQASQAETQQAPGGALSAWGSGCLALVSSDRL